MVEESATIDGLSDLNDLLDKLPAAIQRKVMRGGLRAGQKVIMQRAQELAPVAVPPAEAAARYGTYAGALRDSLRISTRVKDGQVVATLRAGNRKSFSAHWVEFGTKPHIIKARDGKALAFGGTVVPLIHHPGARPFPFMRMAVDATWQEAVRAVADYLGPRINKEILKLPDEVDA